MSTQQSPQQIVHVTSLVDGRPMAIEPTEIWYGRPAKSHLISTAILRSEARVGDVPYRRVNGRRFSPEIRIEVALNERLKEAKEVSRG